MARTVEDVLVQELGMYSMQCAKYTAANEALREINDDLRHQNATHLERITALETQLTRAFDPTHTPAEGPSNEENSHG